MGARGSSTRVLAPVFADVATLREARAPAGEENMCLTSVMAKSLSGPACWLLSAALAGLNTTRCERKSRRLGRGTVF